jgi:hypothetical protein
MFRKIHAHRLLVDQMHSVTCQGTKLFASALMNIMETLTLAAVQNVSATANVLKTLPASTTNAKIHAQEHVELKQFVQFTIMFHLVLVHLEQLAMLSNIVKLFAFTINR